MSAMTFLPALTLLAQLGAATPSAAPASGTPAPAPSAAPTAAPKPPTGPPPEVTVDCKPEPVRVGEPLICTLTAIHPDSTSITVPLPSGAAEVQIVDRPNAPATDESAEGGPGLSISEKRPDGKLQTIRRFQIVPQEPKATVKVPAVTVLWHEAAGGEGTLDVPARKVAVKRLLENAQDPQLRTFKTPQGDAPKFLEAHGPVAFVTTNWWALIACIVLVGGLVGTLLTVVIMRWLANRRRVEVPWVDPRPAHVIALEALGILATEHLPEQGRMKEFYFRLSEIVRGYMERRFRFAAPEMTSDEIRAHFSDQERKRITAELKARGLSDAELEVLVPERLGTLQARVAIEDFLSETDLVKFADFAPSESAAETVMRSARGIIELTREPDAPAPGASPTSTPAQGGAGQTGGAA